MINRRTLIAGTAGLALSRALTGCQTRTAETLSITLLEGSVPSEVLTKFQKQVANPVEFSTISQIPAVFQQLQRWQQADPQASFSLRRLLPWTQPEETIKPHNLVSLADYWLTSAIDQQLIEPLDIPANTLEKLPLPWQQFVNRSRTGLLPNADNTARQTTADDTKVSLWAAPYKVQSLVIVYRQSKFPQSTADNPPFKTWNDLLQPQLKQKLALPNHPRVVLGLVQKMQGGSFNPSFALETPSQQPAATSEDASAENESNEVQAVAEQMAEELEANLSKSFKVLNQQVKTYDSRNSLKALINEDVDAVVGWSGEVVATLNRYRDLRVVVPTEGSLLSADMWVRPKGADITETSQAWIDFCWQADPAKKISVAGKGISPVFLTKQASEEDDQADNSEESALPTPLKDSILPITILNQSEPLLPLPVAQQQAYLALWEKLRR